MTARHKKIAIFLILFILAALAVRLWASDRAVSVAGPSTIRMAGDGTIYVVCDTRLYRHDKQGRLIDLVPLDNFGIAQYIGDFWVFRNGDILLRREVSQKPSFFREIEMFLRSGTGERDAIDSHEGILQRCGSKTSSCTPFGAGSDAFKKMGTFKLFVDEDRENAYIADTLAHQLLLYDLGGNLKGKSDIIFRFPNQIQLGHDGLLYVADTNNHRVAAVSTDAATLGSVERHFSIARRESSPGRVWPFAFAQAPDGHWWVIQAGNDMRNGDLMVYDEDGKFIERVQLPRDADPFSLIALADRVLVTDPSLMRIYTVSLSGELLEDFGSEVLLLKLVDLARKQEHSDRLSKAALAALIVALAAAVVLALASRTVRTSPSSGSPQQTVEPAGAGLGKYDYHSFLPALRVANSIIAFLLLLILALVYHMQPEEPRIFQVLVPLLVLAPIVLYLIYVLIRDTYLELTEQGITFTTRNKKIFSPWQSVQEIRALGRSQYKIYTDRGNIPVGRIEPAQAPTQNWFRLFKEGERYADEVIAEVKRRAPHAKQTSSIFARPL